MKKRLFVLAALLVLAVFCTGVAGYADEASADDVGLMEYEAQGFTVKDPNSWEGLKGSMAFYPVSSTSLIDDPELYALFLYYCPASEEEIENSEDSETIMSKLTMPGMLFTVKGDRERLLEGLDRLGMEDDDRADIVQVGEADGYQFFVVCSLDDDYAASLESPYAEDYAALPALLTRELKQAEYYAPIDPIKALTGKTLSFTTTDLDGNEITSEELFADNEITMVNLWGVWCINCVNEMEELAAINTRLREKGCGIVGLEWEQEPGDETYRQARDLMRDKGTNYPSVLMPEGNEILSAIDSFPATFFVNREGMILTKPILGAKVTEYEPTVEALLTSASLPEEAAEEAATTCRVFVTNEEGEPIKSAVVQLCDESTCSLLKTNADGCAAFEVSEAKSYEVHVLKGPEGYVYASDEVFHTDEKASDLTIVLKKAD